MAKVRKRAIRLSEERSIYFQSPYHFIIIRFFTPLHSTKPVLFFKAGFFNKDYACNHIGKALVCLFALSDNRYI